MGIYCIIYYIMMGHAVIGKKSNKKIKFSFLLYQNNLLMIIKLENNAYYVGTKLLHSVIYEWERLYLSNNPQKY